ncbi:cytochrome P450 [Streptomyces sp. NPDC090798]|uniref:cytochrome P450 n=1 Tax=Streptomyces sp. NPDC090798 TaxID=3365968 RepID=UPI0037FA257E
MSQHDQVVHMPLTTDGPLEPSADWKRLREQCPVATVELPSGDTGTLLTRYDHVKALLSDPRFSRPTAEDDSIRLTADGATGVAADDDRSMSVPLKGEAHLRWRRLLGRYFTVKRVAALRPGMVATAEGLVDSMVKSGQSADLRTALGFPLPIYVICELLGAPAEHRDRFSYWSDAFLSVSRYPKEEITAAHSEFVTYMSELIAAKRAEPGEDVLSTLVVESLAEGEGLTDAELVATGMALLVAGHETTANMIGKMVAMLLADRTRWERLLADPSLVRTAVDEALRFDTNQATFGIRRYLGTDFDVDGQLLQGGATVFCVPAAANRDGRTFADPDEMDLGRNPNPHLTFSAGAHSCLGQSLARTELQVVLEVLLRKLPTLALAVPVPELRKLEGFVVGGLREVPVRW